MKRRSDLVWHEPLPTTKRSLVWTGDEFADAGQSQHFFCLGLRHGFRCGIAPEVCDQVALAVATIHRVDPASHARLLRSIGAVKPMPSGQRAVGLCELRPHADRVTLYFSELKLAELDPCERTRVVLHEAGHALDFLDRRDVKLTKAARERAAEEWATKWMGDAWQ